ncbi:MAG: hypothetical protein ABIS86_17985 [Streptosporangiaceae bacterium]
MTTPDQIPAGSRGKGMPTYVVLDVSGSMKAHQDLLNDTLAKIVNTLYLSPRIAEFIHLSIITFSTTPNVVLRMTGIKDLRSLPTVDCKGVTNFGPTFRLLRERIEVDLPHLAAEGVTVLRPVIFLLTDGAPSDTPADAWAEPLRALTDREWKPYPHIITYGFGAAVVSVLSRMSTLAAYVADGDCVSNSEALSSALSSLLNSLVASAQFQDLRLPEEVRGFRSLSLEPIDM